MVGKKNSEKFRMVVTLTFEKEKKARSRRFFGPTKCRVKNRSVLLEVHGHLK